jgi:hypothetical protein
MGTAPSSDDNLITGLISAVSLDFMNEIKRPDFYPGQDYSEVREGDGGALMVLRHWPINSVASVQLVTGVSPPAFQTIPEATEDISAGWYFDEDVDPERRYELFMDGVVFVFNDTQLYLITYNAGYGNPNASPPVLAPADAWQAVVEWTSYRYKNRQWIGQTSQHLAQGETVQTPESEIPPNVKRIIERYRRFDPLQVPPERVPLLDMNRRQGPKKGLPG